jgi:hypothetical protein
VRILISVMLPLLYGQHHFLSSSFCMSQATEFVKILFDACARTKKWRE